jgi:hypothetical protein
MYSKIKSIIKRIVRLNVITQNNMNLPVFKPRQLFLEQYSLRPESTHVEQLIEDAHTITRATPVSSNPLANHSAFWGHAMYPFIAAGYSAKPLALWAGSNVFVFGRKGGLFFDDQTYDRSSFTYFPWDGTSDCPNITEGGLSYDLSVGQVVEQPVFLGFNGGHTNYSHWLTDHLTMVDVYLDYYKGTGIKIALPDNLSGFARRAVQIMGVEEKDILWVGSRALKFSDLRYLSTFSFDQIPHRFSKAVDRLLNNLGIARDPALATRNIFISRRDATARPFLNAQELEDLMVELGYEIFVTGEMTLEQQIETFSQAKVVIGAHGAGLINAVFCQPGATLIEIFPEYMLQPHFWTAASIRNVNYGYVAGTSFDPDTASITTADAWESASIAPLDQLRLLDYRLKREI